MADVAAILASELASASDVSAILASELAVASDVPATLASELSVASGVSAVLVSEMSATSIFVKPARMCESNVFCLVRARAKGRNKPSRFYHLCGRV
ncbi:MAG: hypothetical protein AAF560_19175 [Acidobacteriota bacterium]